MKQTRLMMGMPVTVEIVDAGAAADSTGSPQARALETVFDYFERVDRRFSPYRRESEVTAINSGAAGENLSEEMRLVMALCEDTKRETNGYFDARRPDGTYDPSGLVKGWAIRNAAHMLRESGFKNFYIDAGGDIEVCGKNARGTPWRIGIRNPWNTTEVVKIIYRENGGVATSGIYERGLHIYNPKGGGKRADEAMSLTVVGPDIYEADRIATAAFAMGCRGIEYLEQKEGFEGYLIDRHGVATMTNGFETYTRAHAEPH